MLIVCGALVNGPYALITTAVSADLVSRATSRARDHFGGSVRASVSRSISPTSLSPSPGLQRQDPQRPPEATIGPSFLSPPSPNRHLPQSQLLSQFWSCSVLPLGLGLPTLLSLPRGLTRA